jgi:lambda family phage portal protein
MAAVAANDVKSPRIAKGFEAGQQGRRLRAIRGSAQAINSLIRTYGPTTLKRSRYLATNNPYAISAKAEYVAALVGCGIKPSSLVTDSALKAELQSLFRDWTDEADADGLTDYYGLQSIVASEMFEAGECFVRIRDRFLSDGLTVPFQLQVLPAEMLPFNHNEILPGGRKIECGIEFDAIGRRVAYWFLRRHPGEMVASTVNTAEKVRVPAEQVMHLFKPIRAGQIRGVPHTIGGLVTLAILDLYDDAELERKRTAALFGAFVVRKVGEEEDEHPLAGTVTSNNPSNFSLEPGVVADLEEGQDIRFAEPADVGATYDPFQYRNLLRAAAGFGVPYSNMTGDLRQSSYGSQRAGLLAFRRRIEVDQNHVVIFQLCRPVWNHFLDLAVLYRAAPINPAQYAATPRRFRVVKHIVPRWDWIDPLKDRQAEKLAVDSGFKPRSDVIEAEGYDPEEVDTRIAADQKRANDLGIKFITLSTSVVVSPDIDSTEPTSDPDA